MALDIARLRYFIVVAEERHITRAAERLDMQQPPLSRQIRLMERELKVQLFRRLPRGVELTSAGLALLPEAIGILARLDRAIEVTRRAARGEQGSLCVGIAPTAAFNPMVPKAIHAFREAFPMVSLVLEEGLSDEVVRRFDNDQMDVAFVRAPQIHAQGVVVTPLQEEPMVVALPRDHAIVKRGKGHLVSLGDLANDPFILIGPQGTGLHDETVAACRAAGFMPRLGQPAPRITSTLSLVAAGLGIALIPSTMQSVRIAGIVYRRLRPPVPKAFLGLAFRQGDPSPVLKQFLNVVRTIAKSSAEIRKG
jgi:DNA-binding transcriptional LysR family regulator